MLLFGKNPELFMPHCIIRIHNSINTKYPYHYIAKGTIMEMLEDSCKFVKLCLEEYNYPIEIIEEHLGKSIIYRDYFDINNCIEIYINNKYIEITNPGAAIIGSENDREKYIKRNMWLYLKVTAIDSEHKYFNKEYNAKALLKGRIKIKYLNLVSKNMFKVIIPLSHQ